MKKYELTDETIVSKGTTLHRIKALRAFGNVKVGDLGGYIEKEENLSHEGNAKVCGDAEVCGVAEVCSNSDFLCFKGLGSVNRNTTFFKCKDGHTQVKCGCFSGNLEKFEQKVTKTHGDSKYAKEYLACVEVVKVHFEVK